MIIIDEYHSSWYGRWKAIYDYFSGALYFGMTPTPNRDDIDIYACFGEPIYFTVWVGH